MLRARPSEITLTQADVEETRRRMARRRPAVPATPGYHKFARPVLDARHRGSFSSPPNAAIIRLGEIPVLRPRRIHSSFDSSPEIGDIDTVELIDSDSEANAHNSSTAPSPTRTPTSARDGHGSSQSLQSPVRNLQLPQQFARPIEAPIVQDQPLSPSTAKHQPQLARNGRIESDASQGFSEGDSLTHPHPATDGFIETTVDTPGSRKRTLEVPGEGSGYSKLEQGTQSQFSLQSLPDRSVPTQLLPDHLLSPERHTFGNSQVLPHTEPRQRPSHGQRVRTMSSSSDPSQLALAPTFHGLGPPSDDYAFCDLPRPGSPGHRGIGTEARHRKNARPSFDERLHRAHQRIASIEGRYQDFFGRRRTEQEVKEPSNVGDRDATQRCSEASSTSSQPFSLYELPTSRHSSSGRSQSSEHLLHSQFDGAGSSRQASRGAYYSVRPSQVGAFGGPQPMRLSSFSSPNLLATSAHPALSPLPARPYERGQRESEGPRYSANMTNMGSNTGEEHDAVSAALHGLPSPLELLEHNTASQLIQLSAHSLVRPASTIPLDVPHQHGHASPPGPHQEPRLGTVRALGSANGAGGQRPRVHSSQLDHHAERASIVRPRQRAAPRMRNNQRSSENAPISTTMLGSQPVARTLQAGQRGSITHDPRSRVSRGAAVQRNYVVPYRVPTRPSLPLSSPRDVSNRARHRSPNRHRTTMRSPLEFDRSDDYYTGSPPLLHQERRDGPRASTPVIAPLRFYDDMPGPRRTPFEFDSSRRNPARSSVGPYVHPERYRAPQGMIVNYQQPGHDTFLTPLDGSRRPQIPARVASRRRISAQQMNQENSGEAEVEMMSNELAVVGLRYGEEGGQLDVMDETPPRIGRFERRMLGN